MYSCGSFSVTFNLLLSPRSATEAQNNSVSNPAGHSYSNVSNTCIQNNHSLLATVKMRTVWIYPDYCPNLLCGPSPYTRGHCIWWPGQLSSSVTTDANMKAYFLRSSTISVGGLQKAVAVLFVYLSISTHMNVLQISSKHLLVFLWRWVRLVTVDLRIYLL